MPGNHSQVVDLGMSDMEYLSLLAQGRDPVREKLYEAELIYYGISPGDAQRLAPLLDKADCSIEEKLQVNRMLKHIWQCITRQIP